MWQWFVRELSAGTPPHSVEGFTDAVAVAYTQHTLQVVRSDGTVWNQGDNVTTRSAMAPHPLLYL